MGQSINKSKNLAMNTETSTLSGFGRYAFKQDGTVINLATSKAIPGTPIAEGGVKYNLTNDAGKRVTLTTAEVINRLAEADAAAKNAPAPEQPQESFTPATDDLPFGAEEVEGKLPVEEGTIDAPAKTPKVKKTQEEKDAEKAKKDQEKADAKAKKDAEKAEAKAKKDAERLAAKEANGTVNSGRKLDYAAAQVIRGRLANGEKVGAIAKELGVDAWTIKAIACNYSYKVAEGDTNPIPNEMMKVFLSSNIPGKWKGKTQEEIYALAGVTA